jgi:hypothetical protein
LEQIVSNMKEGGGPDIPINREIHLHGSSASCSHRQGRRNGGSVGQTQCAQPRPIRGDRVSGLQWQGVEQLLRGDGFAIRWRVERIAAWIFLGLVL